MSKLIYTSIIGNYDTLKEPSVITKGWKYICFTDQNFKSNVWEIVKVNSEPDKVRQARKIKIEIQQDYSESIWVDGSFTIIGDADLFAMKAGKHFMMLLNHPHRNNIFEEANACINRNKDVAEVIRTQMMIYKREFNSYPVLPATGIIYRKHNAATNEHASLWLREVMEHSKRDQLSFGYAALKTGVNYYLLKENLYDKNNRFFLLNVHNKR